MNKQKLFNNLRIVSVVLVLFIIAFVSFQIVSNKEDSIVSNSNIKQLPSIPGQPVKWIKTVNSNLVEVPKVANNIKVSTSTLGKSKTQLSLTKADRIKLSNLSKDRINSEESLALAELIKKQNAKGFFASISRIFSKIGSMFATVGDANTGGEMVTVDVSTFEQNSSSDYQSTTTEEKSTTTEQVTSGGGSSGEESTSSTSTTPIVDEATTTATTTLAVEYETPSPVIAEAITDTGKIVTVSATDTLDVPITNVLAFTNIPEIYKVGQEDKIKIKWTNNDNQNVTFKAYDLNNNGKLDYVEWTVPHLSTQTFEIIFISKAFQLDPNKEILSDIYDTVKTQDGNYAPISDGQYIRVTFEKILTNKNDITIYAKPASSTPVTIEAYTTDTNQLVATFTIDHEGLYKQLIPDLASPTDVFDLKITGDVDIDYVVDPTPSEGNYE